MNESSSEMNELLAVNFEGRALLQAYRRLALAGAMNVSHSDSPDLLPSK
jgi:hypothetical protein